MSRKEIFWVVFILAGIVTLFLTVPGNRTEKETKIEEGLEGPSGPKFYVILRFGTGYTVEEANNEPIYGEDLKTIGEGISKKTGGSLGIISTLGYDVKTGMVRKMWIQVLGTGAKELPYQIVLDVE